MTLSRALTYKLPLSLGLAIGLCLAVPAAASEKTVHGAILPGGSREVGQDRYRSPEGFEDTLKFYSKAYSWDTTPASTSPTSRGFERFTWPIPRAPAVGTG